MATSQPAFAAGTITTTTIQQDTSFRIGPSDSMRYKKAIKANVKNTIAAINQSNWPAAAKDEARTLAAAMGRLPKKINGLKITSKVRVGTSKASNVASYIGTFKRNGYTFCWQSNVAYVD